MPQIVLTSFTQASSHLSWQQNASIEQISATHGSHVIASSSPAAQIGCAQSQAAPQSDIYSATHASVNAPEQHVGFCAHTAETHGSAPHVAFAVAMQSPSHAGGEPWQQDSSTAHVSATQGSKQSPSLSAPPATQTECGHVGGGAHAPQSAGHVSHVSPSHAPSPQHPAPQSASA
jgi:hypothetical protein